ncbi:hypothetical protein K7G90_000712 [Pasteurella canis]|uniref:Transmembrane protein n=1 Tax=Pasteurella canis TaxID=753 RepID=A0A379ETL8_9PAST|nr:hypothetical protein [Pasteurella canis]MXN87787.1 hypothetical protein [Pasteurella canis]UAX42903.1 hypothetical protein K7G89_000756 [Pasteurella canis]UAY78415.1 hypothetical protein K7G90_000712 [Pasteurella canis]UDW84489.1 hypothetical protein K7G91_000767 [Pasteurella canis]UEA17609.1 hypothetical protein K7G92_000825 [Pasteurella canis]
MFKHISNLIFSSASMAFLVILGWSTAYSYGWGQSYFYGYPWWYVDIHISNIARTTGYVISVTLILANISFLAIYAVRKLKPFLSYNNLNRLRASSLSFIIWLPLLIINFLLTGYFNYLVILIYIILFICFTFIIKGYIEKYITFFKKDIILKCIYNHQYCLLIFTYLYFVIAAFVIGYFRPCFTQTFDMVEFNHKMYYVLSKYDDAIILSEQIKKDGKDFYIYRINTNVLNHIKTGQPAHLVNSECNQKH